MPMGLKAVHQLGLAPEALPGDDFSGLEYRSRRQRVVLSLPGSARGRGMRRTALIAALHRETCRQGTVSHYRDTVRGLIWEENRIAGVQGVQRDYRAAVVIAADGVHSGLARRAGLTMRPRGERMALRLHYRSAVAALSATVRVGLFAPYDIYLTPVGGGEFLATTMTDRAGYEAIERRTGDGYFGWSEAGPFDAIIVTCAAGHLPPPLWEQLAAGGRIVIPIGSPHEIQRLVLARKEPDGTRRTRTITSVRFVPLTGGEGR